jgi:hypothetical protein
VTLPKSAPAAWTCPNCRAARATPFCPTCGERPIAASDLTLRGLLANLAVAVSSVDGRLVRTVRALMTQPGALTLAWVEGRQKPYLGPFQLFLLANVAFFGLQSLMGGKIFSTPLDHHLHNQMWSELAQRLVTQRLATLHETQAHFAPLFDQAVVRNAKSLIVLMALAFSLVPPLLFRRSGRPFAAHLVFALHFYAFLLLLFCAALTVAAGDVFFGGAGLQSDRVDHVLSLLLLAVCAAYLYVATGRVFEARGAARVLKVATLTVSVAAIVLGYRFALLLITLYGT